MRTAQQTDRLGQDLRDFAEECIRTELDAGWSFRFDRARRRVGACEYRSQTISVSWYALPIASPEELRQTVLHEIAHAQAGREAGHGRAWVRAARRLGYTGGRTSALDMAAVYAPWVGICPAGHVHYRYRRPTRPTSCGVCSGAFNPRRLIRWHRREPEMPRVD